ncbi:MAG: NHL repeat-containing protein [Candidatus Hydrogenedentes bacterium]|nr:NHL repeat-containing protein [Candidatus Hydrogenedentota bacterium]
MYHQLFQWDKPTAKIHTALLLCVLASLCTATSQAQPGRARISPSLVSLAPGTAQPFKVIMLAQRMMGARLAADVTWSVNGIPGGSAELGTISGEGLYQAPAAPPAVRELHIGAAAPEARNPQLFATVLMEKPGPAYEFVATWGEAKTEAKYFSDPHCIALERDGNVLIADYGGDRVMRFSPQGDFISDIGAGKGEGPGQIRKPRVVAVDAQGRIFVTDEKSDKPRVQVFDRDGKFLQIFAPKGTRPGDILRAHGMDFDAQQRLFITDVDNMRVSVYSSAGDFLYTFGKDGDAVADFNAPHGLAVDPAGEIFVSGYYGPCKKFTPEGEYLFSFAEGDPPDGHVYVHSLADDQWGNVYLMVRGERGYNGALQDNTGHTISIMKYNNNGDYITGISLAVSEHKENWAAIDPAGRVYALFESEDRFGVQIYGPR